MLTNLRLMNIACYYSETIFIWLNVFEWKFIIWTALSNTYTTTHWMRGMRWQPLNLINRISIIFDFCFVLMVRSFAHNIYEQEQFIMIFRWNWRDSIDISMESKLFIIYQYVENRKKNNQKRICMSGSWKEFLLYR